MKDGSKRCPIEPFLSCDIVDECNPVVVPESDFYAISSRCPYLKSRAKRRKPMSDMAEHEH